MSYSIRLVSTPTKPNKKAVEIASRMDKEQFPGCEVYGLIHQYVWLAYYNTTVVGYASMKYLPIDKCGYFSRAAIKKEHRRKGLHTRLIRARINLARRLKWKGVLTYTAIDNIASANSLVSLDFRLYIPEYRWAGKEFLYFIRSL